MSYFKSAALALVFAAWMALPANAHPSSTVAQQITRVENGLLTVVTIAGTAPQKMTIPNRMKRYHVPAVSIAFFNTQGILWERAYGATPETLFQAGSISKPVSAVGIMELVQAGRLNLDTNINAQLQTWKVPQNAFTAKHAVTLRELLSHTAGTTVHGFDGYERGKLVPTLLEVLNGKHPANSAPIRVNLQPGKQFRYSGGGYVVAEQLVLDTVQEPFAEYMQRNVLEPMGMTHSTFEQPLPRRLWHQAATATQADGKPYPGFWNVYPEQTAAGLWTTAGDLARFAIGMQRALDGDPNAVISQSTAREMLTPVKADYGLGFIVTSAGAGSRFGHDGANAGFEADFVMYRNGEGVAIMTNSDRGGQLMPEIYNSIAQEYGWADYHPKQKRLTAMDPSAYGRFTGTYDIPGAGLYRVIRRGDALFMVGPAGMPFRLYPQSAMSFFLLDQDVDINFTTGASGKIDGLSIPQFRIHAKEKKVGT